MEGFAYVEKIVKLFSISINQNTLIKGGNYETTETKLVTSGRRKSLPKD